MNVSEARIPHRYWYFFVPLTLFLALMVKYPLRIHVQQSIYSAVFYGLITLACLLTAIWVYRRWGKRCQHLILVIVLCSALSGWQVVDLLLLRTDWANMSGGFCPLDGSDEYCPPHYGFSWYDQRFVEQRSRCDTPMLLEWYFGNKDIAITVSIWRNATWFPCGG